ncbi:DNA translocase FtsK [Haloplasma contractile]|uniref:Biotin synthetase protein n=1 Tax=Haloplasma contractile SSD-17B TaxID=1033810 RepID=U2EFA8_9MOLU|nr:DNA translocase FtsK [Haloplasma contractile]ERJ13623.1 biotin synthetase protein [Haloplasma contractile SSD-17B]
MGTKDKVKKTTKKLKNNRQRKEKFSIPLIPYDDELNQSQSFGEKRKQYNTSYRTSTNSLNNQSRITQSSYFFVSPIYGKLEDKSTYPQTTSNGSIDKQYDFLRDKKRLNNTEFKKKHGSDFYEFSLRKNKMGSNKGENQPTNEQNKDRVITKDPSQKKSSTTIKQTPNKQDQPFSLNSEANSKLKQNNEKKKDKKPEERNTSNYKDQSKSNLRDLSISNQKSKKIRKHNEEQALNVIFEEEFELNEEDSVLTSYNGSSDKTFFNDFKTPHIRNHEFEFEMTEYDEEVRQSDESMNHFGHDDANPFKYFEVDDNKEETFLEEGEHLFNPPLDSEDDEPIYKDEFIFKVDFNDGKNSEFEEDSFGSDDHTFEDVNKDLNNELDSGKTRKQNSKRQQHLNLSENDYDNDDDWSYDNREYDKVNQNQTTSNKNDDSHNKDNHVQFSSYELSSYQLPPISLLKEGQKNHKNDIDWIHQKMTELDETLQSFDLDAKTIDFTQGPTVTRLEVKLAPGIKVSKITSLQDNIKLGLAVNELRIEAPIPGKNTIGIEIPNVNKQFVCMRDIFDTPKFQSYKSPLKVVLGLDITGEPIYSDISKMPHGLIAGSTGSGKSVCINNIIVSLLYNTKPDEVKLILIDPKMVELAPYNNIPHLLTPVITDPKTATASLKWAAEEMDRRYSVFARVGARDIKAYNSKRKNSNEQLEKIPYIVIIIDELADLMTVAAQDTEESILRIAQKARAAGIHLILATQRPSVNIITGNIKINIPTRIAFKVQSLVDSRTILDESGAEKLLGKGDMLLLENGMPEVMRLQGSFISDDEIDQVTTFICDQLEPKYAFTKDSLVKSQAEKTIDHDDELYDEVARYLIDCGEASASRIQRRFSIGFNRAARLLDIMEQNGIVSPSPGGSKPREVLISLNDYKKLTS